MATVTIDGKKLQTADGTPILEAAAEAGITIPTFCTLPKITRRASCRLCLIEIVGQRKLQPACVTPVIDGMAIQTASPNVVRARTAMLEFILANHPLDCPICDKAGECELQNLVFTYGPHEEHFHESKRVLHRGDMQLSATISKNADRCVQCQRCVRVCEEIVGSGAMGCVGRGANTQETGFFDDLTQCDHCGNCIEACPVGALMSTPFRNKARIWDLTETETVCPYCGTGCLLTAGLRDGRLVRVTSSPDTGVNQELLCAKGRYGLDYVESGNRLQQPMVRQDGDLKPTTWDHALEYISRRLGPILEQRQACAGLASPRLTSETLYAFQKMMRTVFHTNNIDCFTRWAHDPAEKTTAYPVLGRLLGDCYTRQPLPALLDSDCVLLVGCNVSDENPVTDYMLRHAKAQRLLRLHILSSRPTRLDGIAHSFARLIPGAETQLLASILKGLVTARQSLEDGGLTPEFTQLAENLARIAESDVPRHRAFLLKLTADLLTADAVTLLIGSDLLRSPDATVVLQLLYNTVQLLQQARVKVNLQFLFSASNQLGAWDVGVAPTLLPGYRACDDAAARGAVEQLWRTTLPAGPGLDFLQVLRRAVQRQLGALYVVGSDPIHTCPDLLNAREALTNVDLLIVQDTEVSETARLADVVLPGCSFAEQDGTFTNNEGRIQPVRRFMQPPDGAQPDPEIFAAITECLNGRRPVATPGELQSEIRALTPHRHDWQEAGSGQEGHPPASLGSHPVHLYQPAWRPRTTPQGFSLFGGNSLFHSGTKSIQSAVLQTIEESGFAELNAHDAAALGINERDQLIVSGNGQEVSVPARLNRDLPQGALFIPDNFPELQVNRLYRVGEYPCPVTVRKAVERTE